MMNKTFTKSYHGLKKRSHHFQLEGKFEITAGSRSAIWKESNMIPLMCTTQKTMLTNDEKLRKHRIFDKILPSFPEKMK